MDPAPGWGGLGWNRNEFTIQKTDDHGGLSMLYPHTIRLALLALALVFLNACTQKSESDGTLAVVNGKTELILNQKQAQDICAKHFCEPNYYVYAHFGRRRSPPKSDPAPTPNPTPRPTARPSQPVNGHYAHAAMNVASAWQRTHGSAQVTVAVIDSGVDAEHPHLRQNLAVNEIESRGRPGVDDDQNGLIDDVYGYDFSRENGRPIDESGHGTHVAGIVLQVAPATRVLHLKFIDGSGRGSTYNAIRAIDYAIARRVQVINASWGGPSYSQLLDQAIQRAVAAGIQFVAAAGNEGLNVDISPRYPARIANVISVAASDVNDQLTEYSNYGNQVSITAPGDQILSSVVGGGWDDMSGTSMASPQVAGALALLQSVRGTTSTPEVLNHLCQTADSKVAGGSQCGRINVGRAIQGW
jgi:subtilisin family serine protease